MPKATKQRGPYAGASPGLNPSGKSQRQVNLSVLRHKKVLTPEEAAYVMIGTGWPKDVFVISTGLAILKCESAFGANRGPNGKCNPAGACGPWQIGAVRGGAAGYSTNPRCANDWVCASRVALKLYKSRGWQPWDASKGCWEGSSGGFEGTVQGAIDGAGNIVGDITGALGSAGNAVADAVTAPLDGIKAIAALIGRLFQSSFWVRTGKVILGFVMLIFGIAALSKALLGLDLGNLAEGTVGAVGGAGKRASRSVGSGGRMSTQEAASRAGAQQAARERAKTEGQETRNKRFFERMEEPPF